MRARACASTSLSTKCFLFGCGARVSSCGAGAAGGSGCAGIDRSRPDSASWNWSYETHAMIIVVLDEPQDLVNIAHVVRGMTNFGLRDLRLVNPREYDAYRVEGIAHQTQDILAR